MSAPDGGEPLLTYTPLDATSFGGVLTALGFVPVVLCALGVSVVAVIALRRGAMTRGLWGLTGLFMGIAALWTLQGRVTGSSRELVRAQAAPECLR